ncbi:hypothetical protein [Pseudomonas fluorescens]|uniref:Uncharacterized protein n=1 Tax=Pseudomonas fluorescens TaxID=294 RepID=A0A5E7E6L3_PSEFL|nr:hypothetical protein [Pseudomonas fluorescens]VVO22274.1 hypothetical protein PS723_04307 [Pseudomonas fluorescens]
MSDKAEHYQLKGMISDMPADQQAEIKQAEQEVIDIATRSEASMLGATMAMILLSLEAH